jgi:hypothetical protein
VRSNTWPEGEWDEFEELCRNAERLGESTGHRARLFGDMIEGAVQAHRIFARDIEREALRRGFLSIFRQWQKSHGGPVVVSHDGRILTKSRVIGVRRSGPDGTEHHQQLLFDYCTWDELGTKRKEYIAAMRGYGDDIAVIDRLLALRELAPESTTPAEAAKELGTTVDAWLAEDAI